jgi:hypothetical protein
MDELIKQCKGCQNYFNSSELVTDLCPSCLEIFQTPTINHKSKKRMTCCDLNKAK